MRKERDPNFSHLKTASQKLFALLRSMFLGCAGATQARGALLQADAQGPFQLFSDMTHVSIHAATLHVVAIGRPAAAAALAAQRAHSLRTVSVTPARCAYRDTRVHRHSYGVWLYVEYLP